MSNIGFAGVTNFAMTSTATAVRVMGVTGVGGSSEEVQGPSLGLNFLTGPTGQPVLDPRITFSRASNATVTGPDGTLQYAPHNLLTFSEQFDNAAWGKNRSSVTANATTAPDGTATADTLVGDGTGAPYVFRSVPFSSGETYSASVYVNPINATTAIIQSFTQVGLATFSLIGDGSVVSTTGIASNAQIEKLTNGWFRISCLLTATATGNNNLGFTGVSYSGEVWRIWGAQLNVGALQPYYPTTVKNLLGFTQEFDNAAWTKSNSTVTANATTDPQGFMTADKYVAAVGTLTGSVGQTFSATLGAVYVFSAYVKKDVSGFALLQLDGDIWNGVTSAERPRVWLDMDTGLISNSTRVLASGVENVEGDFYRFWLRAACTTAATSTARVAITTANNSTTFVGDGTSGIFIWGAQLSDSASLDQYVYNPGAAPAAAAYYGPRFDYDPVTLAPKGLLIEEQRTNSIRNNTGVGAVAGTPGTAPTNWAITTSTNGITREIVGAGVEGGISYVDVRFFGTPTSGNQYMDINFDSANIVASNGQVWSFSSYIRLVAGSVSNLNSISLIQYGTPGFSDNGVLQIASLLTTAPLSTQRYTVVRTFSTAISGISPRVAVTISAGLPADITLRIGLPQLELGAFATSVIPTTTAAATRAADVAVMTGANFSNWYNQTEGTLYAESTLAQYCPSGSFGQCLWQADDGTSSNRMHVRNDAATTTYQFRSINTDGTGALVGLGFSLNTPVKTALGYKVNDFNGSLGGTIGTTDTTVNPPVLNTFRIGQESGGLRLNGHIRRIAYFPRRLSNAELQAITS